MTGERITEIERMFADMGLTADERERLLGLARQPAADPPHITPDIQLTSNTTVEKADA